MNIEKPCSGVYKAIKTIIYILFLIAYIVICSIIAIIFGRYSEFITNDYLWEWMARFTVGLPLILQLMLTYIVYRKNQQKRIVKILFIATLFFTLACIVLSLYDLYFTYPNDVLDLLFYVSIAQIVFQLFLMLLLLIGMIAKKVYKPAIIKPLIMVVITALFVTISYFCNIDVFGVSIGEFIIYDIVYLIVLFINLFNPVLLYILSYTAKGKLFIKNDQ